MIEEAGYGASGGILGVVLAYFGFSRRVDKMEKDLDRVKDDVVWKDTCQVCHKSTNDRLDRIEGKIDRLIERP